MFWLIVVGFNGGTSAWYSGRLNIEVIAPYRHKAEVFPDDDWEEVRLFRTPSWERLTLSVLVFRYYK